jgi:hypothetical protein
MDLKDRAVFLEAVNLARAGQIKVAYTRLAGLARRCPGEAEVLIWLAYTTPDLLEAKKAICQATALDVYNPNLTLARSWLETELEQHSQTPVVPAASYYWKDMI